MSENLITVKIPFLPWMGRDDLEIQVPLDTPEQWRLRTAVEIAHSVGTSLYGASLSGANLNAASLMGANLIGTNLDGANLNGANLNGARLDRANLYGTRLGGANLYDASLYDANLNGARLIDANLDRANLDGANLMGANLDGASLIGADLNGARLIGANLDRANLDGARLDGARLNGIRNDFWDVLLRAQPEVPGLLAALREGRIDGTTYDGECACLAGTIANLRNIRHGDLGFANPSRPIERWFLGIREGDRPETNQIAAIAEGWILEFQALIGAGAINPGAEADK